jgi:NAD-dependent DNA ligase
MFKNTEILNTISKLNTFTKTKLVNYIKKQELSVLNELIEYMDYYYHNEESLIDDLKYEIILDFVKTTSTLDVNKIGYKIKESNKEIVLPVFMGSINKIKPEDSELLKRWKEKNKTSSSNLITDKLDGVSCLLVTNDKSEIELYTRGDGYKGKDITYIKPYINHLPKSLPPNIMMRGELVMSKENFNSLPGPKVDSRNTVSGCVGAKSLREGLNKIDLVIYENIKSDNTNQDSISDQLDFAEKLGFKTVFNIKIDNDIDIEHLRLILKSRKEESEYDIDGIVINIDEKYKRNTDRNPIYSFAFKEDISTTTKVIEVIWEISRYGLIKPKVRIEPVCISGATINFATAHNAWFIKENNIGKGAVVEIVRSGEVIPKIIDVIEKCENPDFPDIPYHWNETNVDIIADNPGDEMNIKKIVHFMTIMEIKHVSSATIRRVYEKGYDSIKKILQMTINDFLEIDRFGQKLAERTFNSIHDSLKNISIEKLMCASSCFGFGFGVKKIKVLLKKIPDIISRYERIDNVKEWFKLKENRDSIASELINVEGFSDLSVTRVIDGIPKFILFSKSIKKYFTLQEEFTEIIIIDEEEDEVKISELKDKKIVLSGFRGIIDKDIEKLGGEIMSSVSSKTFCVVTKDVNEESSKLLKARSLGILIYSIDDFKKRFILA